MPTYQYACTECAHAFEQVQAFTDDPLTVCPECAGRLRKVFNAVGVVFKGSGFYRTDSRSTAERSAASADAKPAGEKSGSAEKSGSTEKSGSAAKPEKATAAASASSSAAPATSSTAPASS
ncbi:MAG: FmdB family zinc ribbon protein [Nocardioides sp.]